MLGRAGHCVVAAARPSVIMSSESSARGAERAAKQAQYSTASRLLVLDLNGTLLARQKNKSGRTVPGGRITLRPYLECFLRYCLGPMYDVRLKKINQAWPIAERVEVRKRAAPFGTHFWLGATEDDTVYEPPVTPIAVMIWSSATDVNVNKMVEQFAKNRVQRALFQRVWSRETLVRAKDLDRKVTTAKDLSIVWDDLNAWGAHVGSSMQVRERPRFRARAEAADRLRMFRRKARQRNGAEDSKGDGTPREPSPRSGSDELYAESMNRMANGGTDSVYGPMVTFPWGPQNTILLDDSLTKARCQPNNHICIHEFGAKDASETRERLESEDPAARDGLDDYLLQVVGFLDAMQDEADVSAWIARGHTAYLAEDPAAVQDSHRLWADRGRTALARCGIPLVP